MTKTICNCGNHITIKCDNYCSKCQKIRRDIKKGIKSGKLKIDLPKSVYTHRYYKQYNIQEKRQELIDFVDRLERRRCMATTTELFCDLITLYSIFFTNQRLLYYPVNEQLKHMWQTIRDYRHSLDKDKVN